MKTIGLLGGMSWESTTTYYKLINESVKEKLGGLHSAKICLYSVDFNEIERLQHEGNWDATAVILSDAAQKVQAGGAEFLVICTNTMHKVASQIEQSISIPILHIADATAEELMEKADSMAKRQFIPTRSEFIRMALRHYIRYLEKRNGEL